jgi:hypothetical protein
MVTPRQKGRLLEGLAGMLGVNVEVEGAGVCPTLYSAALLSVLETHIRSRLTYDTSRIVSAK